MNKREKPEEELAGTTKINLLKEIFTEPYEQELLEKAIGQEAAEAVFYALKHGVKDHLTGLYRRELITGGDEQEGRWHEEVMRAKRNKHPLSMALVDLKGLKQMNNEFDWATGDKALQMLATLLLRVSRATDTVVRWGGDEYMVVLPETDSEDARQKFMGRVIKGLEGIGVYFGVAEWKEGKSFDELLLEANQELNEQKKAKKGGRE